MYIQYISVYYTLHGRCIILSENMFEMYLSTFYTTQAIIFLGIIATVSQSHANCSPYFNDITSEYIRLINCKYLII